MSYQLTITGHTASAEKEAEVVVAAREFVRGLADMDDCEVSTAMASTQHSGSVNLMDPPEGADSGDPA